MSMLQREKGPVGQGGRGREGGGRRGGEGGDGVRGRRREEGGEKRCSGECRRGRGGSRRR